MIVKTSSLAYALMGVAAVLLAACDEVSSDPAERNRAVAPPELRAADRELLRPELLAGVVRVTCDSGGTVYATLGRTLDMNDGTRIVMTDFRHAERGRLSVGLRQLAPDGTVLARARNTLQNPSLSAHDTAAFGTVVRAIEAMTCDADWK